ncbi:MAG: hypothetical protein L0Y38_12010, partial [Methylococcaceae bacterium]|nr:hypothetical protein [Methylococcaceae bacterium]
NLKYLLHFIVIQSYIALLVAVLGSDPICLDLSTICLTCGGYKSLFKISIKGCSARQNWAKKRSIHVVFEHFEASFNAAMRPSARS